ncbi:MAG: type II toxin-antitoxin system PemK/MazF family toxin [Candidatus Pacebacteria bacterium]|nr:type II toxin-antitoxin system PemK/MazF family toxin [Candidatus Paceibacterota bacterium]
MYRKGTIVLVPFPFTDLTGNKVRPALIISANRIGQDLLVVFITSQKKKQTHTVKLEPSESSGIKIASHIVCSKIATLDKKVVLGELGMISENDQKAVDEVLREVIGL